MDQYRTSGTMNGDTLREFSKYFLPPRSKWLALMFILIFGAAAAMRFDCPDDPQSVELLGKIQQEGPAAALAAYSGLKPENPLFGRILDVYRALAIV